MTSFASLMALSATHTKESQRVVEDALQERRRKEIQRAKQRAERELEEKERERKLLLKRFEDEKRDRERLERLEVERQAKELALQRREEEQRDTLRYGPKKAAKLAGKHSTGHPPNWPSSSASNREAVRKLRVGDDQDDGPSSPALTREEIRERKLQAELRKTYVNARRSTATGGYSKRGKKLPGGALDIKTSSTTIELAAGQTVKERLASLPMTLKVLGGRNKDRRSELEMFYDSKRKRSGQVLEGDEARNFNEYFAPSKKEKEKLKQVQAISTSANTSGADSPGPGPRSSGPTTSKQTSATKPPPAPASTSKQSHTTSAHTRGTSKQALSATSSASKAPIPKINKTNTITPRPSTTAHSRPKRPRSPSLSESPSPKRRQMESDDISSTIWKMFGKDRKQYTSRDVFSDDEDMEADATILEREEAYSARIAKKEEMLAIQEEERHEEEKRRRKKERERAAARAQ